MSWNPVKEPYRVGWLHKGDHLPYGWHLFVKTYATEAEAIAEAEKPFGRCVTEATVEIAVNPETWTRNGRWQRIGKRQRKGTFRRFPERAA